MGVSDCRGAAGGYVSADYTCGVCIAVSFEISLPSPIKPREVCGTACFERRQLTPFRYLGFY